MEFYPKGGGGSSNFSTFLTAYPANILAVAKRSGFETNLTAITADSDDDAIQGTLAATSVCVENEGKLSILSITDY